MGKEVIILKGKKKLIIISAISLVIVAAAIILTLFILKKGNSKIAKPFSQSDTTVTLGQFVSALLFDDAATSQTGKAFDEKTFYDEALELGILADGDAEMKDLPILRQGAARIAHNYMLNILNEEDELTYDAATAVPDMFTCRVCVQNVAQLYVKGIMDVREDGLFHGDSEITGAEARFLIDSIFDTSLRTPKTVEMLVPDVTDDGAIEPDEAMNIIYADNTAMLIDVRTEEEYSTGYIMGSCNIPLDKIQNDLANTSIPEDKDTVLILYCQSGARSAMAMKILRDAGYTKVFNLGGVETWPYELVN